LNSSLSKSLNEQPNLLRANVADIEALVARFVNPETKQLVVMSRGLNSKVSSVALCVNCLLLSFLAAEIPSEKKAALAAAPINTIIPTVIHLLLVL
jgi:hypothetical protein